MVGVDVDAEHEIYHPDAVREFPQSRERFEGVANFHEWRGKYPGKVTIRTEHFEAPAWRERWRSPWKDR